MIPQKKKPPYSIYMPRIDLHQLPIWFRKGSKAALIGHGEGARESIREQTLSDPQMGVDSAGTRSAEKTLLGGRG
jgi:hypothetical protein